MRTLSSIRREETGDIIRMLHVDDEADQRVYTRLFLERADPYLQIESTSSADKALRMLQNEDFDCVVSDYRMPGMDGIELARILRESSDIPFFILTAWGSEEVAEAAIAAGVNGYLRRRQDPSYYQVLAKQIRRAVKKTKEPEQMEINLSAGYELHSVFIEILRICVVLENLIRENIEAPAAEENLVIQASGEEGSITVESDPRKETIFTIKLPK